MKSIFKTKSKKTIIILILSIISLVFFSSIVYSAFSSTMNISGFAHARVEADVRITDFSISDTSNSSISMYENFSKDTISSEVILKENSSVTYNLEMTNYGSVDAGLYSISGIPDGVNYSIEGYNLKDKICDQNGKCNNYVVRTYSLKIYTTDSSYDGVINLQFDFRVFHRISYVGFTGSYIDSVIDGDSVVISFETENIDFALVNSLKNIFNKYDNKKLFLSNVIADVEIIAVKDSVKQFDYTGNEQTYIASYTGLYKLELWGAQGGNAGDSRGGYGGYSTGYIKLNSGDKLYINVGGAGGGSNTFNECSSGGYNGGGSTCSIHDAYFGSGGGATHIALKSGLLSSFFNDRSNVLIVAGGGGGAGYYNGTEPQYSTINDGGDAGGIVGNKGNGRGIGYGGSQIDIGRTNYYLTTSFPAFGLGANGSSTGASGGGSGYFGGGVGYSYGSSAGGGSGSVSNKKIIKGYMSCYKCEISNGFDTKTISTDVADATAVSDVAKIGNGYAKISYVGDESIIRDELIFLYLEFDSSKSTTNTYKISEVDSLDLDSYMYLGDSNSIVSFKISIMNNSYETYKFNGILEEFYDNRNIKYEIDGLNIGDVISQGEQKEFSISFSYVDFNSITEKKLNSSLIFDFYAESYVIEYDAIDDTRTLKVKHSGLYRLEVWGAQGGGVHGNVIGGAGGYSAGEIYLNKDDIFYIVVGGKGDDSDFYSTCSLGGYNGGGNACSVDDTYFAAGGGATHIATKTGLLSSLSDSWDAILIVAGGGGGAGYYTGDNENYNTANGGGCGGGFTGMYGSKSSYGYGGTQSEGGTGPHGSGSFGQGGSINMSNSAGSGGGAGLYGGGTGYSFGSSAGGGSGYIANSLLMNKYMICYNCGSSNDVQTKTSEIYKISAVALSDTPKKGNGYAKITLLEIKR